MKKIVVLAAVFNVIFTVSASNDVAAGDEELVCHNGLYFGFGFNLCDSGDKNEYKYAPDPTATDPEDKNPIFYPEINAASTRVGGSVILGYGKKLPERAFYIGLECGLDFKRNAEYASYNSIDEASTDRRYFDEVIKRNGLTPSLALRIGHYDCDSGILTFLKVGASYVKSTKMYTRYEVQYTTAPGYVYETNTGFGTDELSTDDPGTRTPTGVFASNDKYAGMKKDSSVMGMSVFQPIVALGIERAFTKKVSARLEVEYRFGKSKTKVFSGGDESRLTQKASTTIRSLICYNVQL
ncbi:MAG: hypothetical protein LBT70_03940 [Holosporaceae bacterium]|jgi:opacity protein-like surface antigen|nr:hypothetical protein [Holosporaceae bacterium]